MRLVGLLLLLSWASVAQTFIPAGGNSWTTGQATVTKDGVQEMVETSVATTYARLQPGNLELSLIAGASQPVKVKVSIQSIEKVVDLGPAKKEHAVGSWSIIKEGYVGVTVTGFPGTFQGLLISGSAVSDQASYVKNNEGNFFYWGRRGPSVHLRYDLQGRTDIEWFYSEIIVPGKNDVIGSYYMANGFADGYFGFQVNSETERRILFSVWSPFQTEDPKAIPEEDRIILVKKGVGVYTGEFGNEGSGGQSYLRYPWKAAMTYGFLLRAQPEGANTIYTAWFFAPELASWKLIASWKRPKKATYLSSLYSFLENFIPETGNIERRAIYGNQWARDKAGNWIELTQVKFTGDNTARKNFRKDYGGGLIGDAFFLRNCGFFSDFTALDQNFIRPNKKIPPSINFSALP